MTTDAPMMLELWQTEWCPSSHRVRQRLTELGLTYVVRQVPVAQEARSELLRATGAATIPVLVAGGRALVGEPAILTFLDENYIEPPGAGAQRAKAARAQQKQLEAECRKLTVRTP